MKEGEILHVHWIVLKFDSLNPNFHRGRSPPTMKKGDEKNETDPHNDYTSILVHCRSLPRMGVSPPGSRTIN